MHFLVLTSDRKTLGSVLACFKHIETTTNNTSMESATGSNSLEEKTGAVKDEPMTQVVKNLSNKLFQSVLPRPFLCCIGGTDPGTHAPVTKRKTEKTGLLNYA